MNHPQIGHEMIVGNRGPGGAARQAAALRQEGVTVGTTALGEFIVDLR